MKILIAYYSNTGSNKYLADKIAQALSCDIEAIKPRLNLFPLLMFFSVIKAGLGIKSLKHKVKEYDRIILCGPIWMGKFISPLRDFINKHGPNVKKLYFVTCCGSTDAAKRERFGHALVFDEVHKILGDKCIHCEAFPIGLVLPADNKDNNAIMKTRLSDQNFTGEIQKRFDNFIQVMKKL
jgi:flavodoxin